jgi:glycosyltransferase involved in cell wall biosynthesis
VRIAILAPVSLPVPPLGYGGTELVVHQLAEGLVDAGHAVTLFATGDSRTRAATRALLPRALTPMGFATKESTLPFERAHAAWAFAQAADFDLIHDHTKAAGVTLAPSVATPVLTTVHNDFSPERRQLYLAHPDHAYVAISHAHARRCPELNFLGVVYNGMDLKAPVFRACKENYMLFLGRLCAEKGTQTAIAVARALGIPLVLAGKIDPVDADYVAQRIMPHVDGASIRYVGEVTGRQKWELIAGARCLLFPIQWPEPFGLVMIEAMACGTPVVATRWGSVPEVVAHGETGWIADDFEGLLEGVRAAVTIDPRACRRRVAERFGTAAMVAGYLALYERLLKRSPRPVSRRP